MRLVISADERLRLGILEPGFTPGGSCSHMRRLSGVMSKVSPAKADLLKTWVRLGPTIPVETPLTVWQPAQPLTLKRVKPSPAGVPGAGVAGPAFWAATQFPQSLGV